MLTGIKEKTSREDPQETHGLRHSSETLALTNTIEQYPNRAQTSLGRIFLKALQEKPDKCSFKGEGRRQGQLCPGTHFLICTPTVAAEPPSNSPAHPPAAATLAEFPRARNIKQQIFHAQGLLVPPRSSLAVPSSSGWRDGTRDGRMARGTEQSRKLWWMRGGVSGAEREKMEFGQGGIAPAPAQATALPGTASGSRILPVVQDVSPQGCHHPALSQSLPAL